MPERVAFVGLAPAQAAGSGFHLFTLDLADGSLLLGWRPLRGAEDVEQTVLLEGVEALELAYYDAGGDDAPAAWRSAWTATARLPALVRIAITFADPARPRQELVVRPMIERADPR